MKKRKLLVAYIVYSFIIVVLAVTYVNCAGLGFDKEGHRNAEKLYGRISDALSDIVEDKCKMLEVCQNSISAGNNGTDMGRWHKKSEEMRLQPQWANLNILFIDRYGNYISLSGETGCINSKINAVLNSEKKAIVSGEIEEDKNVEIFSIAVEPTWVGNFQYCTVAVVYEAGYIENELKKYNGDRISWYIIGANGNFLYAHDNGECNAGNIISYFENTMGLSGEEITLLKENLANYGSGNITYQKNDEDYYFTYIHKPKESWTVAGIGRADMFISNVDYIKIIVVTAVSVAFAIIIIVIMNVMISGKWNISGKKFNTIRENNVFDILSKGCDDIFIVLSSDCRKVEYVSDNIQKILGTDYKFDGKNGSDLLKIKMGEKDFIDIQKIRKVNVGEEIKDEKECYNSFDGQIHWYLQTICHADDDFGERYIIVLSDRTDAHDKNRHIQQALDIAKNANMAKSKFISVISHDTRTPVNAIAGMAALIAKEPDKPEKVAEYAEKISVSCHHLQNLVNDILDINKIESGKSTLNIAKFSMAKMLQDISQVVRTQARNKKQMFIIETDNLRHNVFIGDKMRISQVIINILSNAIKYTGINGEIRLRVQEEVMKNTTKCASKLVFTIKDNGSGMSREYQNVLFEPFSRENSMQATCAQGTGLGMVIAKNLVELMGGTIQVVSEIGVGSEFAVSIYLEAEEVYQREKKKNVQEPEENSCAMMGKRALIAEDYEINARILTEILKMEGISAEIATNGREAVKMFETSSEGYYDIILMDIQMPLMGGYDAIRYIRNCEHPDAKTIPICVMTANSFDKEIDMAKEAGMDEYVTKPIDIKILRSKLCKLL